MRRRIGWTCGIVIVLGLLATTRAAYSGSAAGGITVCPAGPPAFRSLRLAIIPLIKEPCSRSRAAIFGKAEARERRFASPAKTPSTIGATSLSAA